MKILTNDDFETIRKHVLSSISLPEDANGTDRLFQAIHKISVDATISVLKEYQNAVNDQ